MLACIRATQQVLVLIIMRCTGGQNTQQQEAAGRKSVSELFHLVIPIISIATSGGMRRLVHEEEFRFRRLPESIQRRRQHVRMRRRLNEPRRHDDDQFALIALVTFGREQRPQHRHIAEPRRLPDIVGIIVLQQTRDGKACPSRSSIVVSARRTEIPGISMLAARMPLLRSRAETSGRTRRLTSPSPKHGRGEIQPDTELLEFHGDLAIALAATGIGNSPPARKLAVSPDRATRFGSASVRIDALLFQRPQPDIDILVSDIGEKGDRFLR
jgi:hypothetical protein